VRFPSADGVRLAGRLFGHGSTVVILSHMGPGGNDQSQWWPMAHLLAERGYRVLTYDYSGVCPGGKAGCSKGVTSIRAPAPNLMGAIHFVDRLGVKRVVLGGASMGAMASLKVAARPGVDVSAVISLSGVEQLVGPYELGRHVIARISEPKLFMAGEFDHEAADSARDWLRWARPPKDGKIMNTGLHGTDMIDLASGDDAEIPGIVIRRVAGFLDRYAPAALSVTGSRPEPRTGGRSPTRA
jgi:pimeloyl-ACP methyl ester carboxylesterase